MASETPKNDDDFIALATYVDDLGAAGSNTATLDNLLAELP